MLGLRRDWRPDASGSTAARGSASVVAVVESSGVGERESVGKGGDVIAFVGMGGMGVGDEESSGLAILVILITRNGRRQKT